MKGKIDQFLARWTSRKLMVFFIATLLAIFGDLESSDWVIIAGIYIGGQTVIDAIATLKFGQSH